jgi:hypothetical protein
VVADGDQTENPDRAHAEPTSRRVWFRVEEVELKWLRISETAFLLWVLAFLVLAWLTVALLLLLL